MMVSLGRFLRMSYRFAQSGIGVVTEGFSSSFGHGVFPGIMVDAR